MVCVFLNKQKLELNPGRLDQNTESSPLHYPGRQDSGILFETDDSSATRLMAQTQRKFRAESYSSTVSDASVQRGNCGLCADSSISLIFFISLVLHVHQR